MTSAYKCLALVILVFVTGAFAIADGLALFNNNTDLHMIFSVIYLFDFVILFVVCVALSFSRKCGYYESEKHDKYEDEK